MLKELTKSNLDTVLGDIKTLDIECAFVAVSDKDSWALGVTSGTRGYRPIAAVLCGISMSEKDSFDAMYSYAMKLNTEHLGLSTARAAAIIAVSMGYFHETKQKESQDETCTV